ncbi:WXG100 family type VII secretion target [Mycobacteroides immunogenum]|uniref:ESAT-6-like protein n=1 Tax=Mycobacteroides immunogenum TaxID=83262 RepID=A0A7V8LMS4_9MYCO|nr:type VII secretion target [Mycobacteroides immunogenum]AMT72405.1 hypothetical protein ABG82_21085 [Mycobacteroides immunogenum]ANO05554.1 hypothetical protein BAB75_21355 [Mycobacteroides immunogenum]KIU41535.1 hypothetical protein TL11_05920 [Mycobacteroides immunogenum]KPG06548.1 hypothetical protein AN909_18525 [Mycobacteroides immunogenum]KPG08337.1 hypothetical protein AN908_18005 [Mycobacteroides immunogenum]
MGKTRIDVAGVQGVAGEFDSIAGELQKAIEQLRGLSFGGASAGRWHTAKGDAVMSGLREVVTHLEDWYRTNAVIAEQLRATAQRYAETEAKSTEQVTRVYG